MWNTIVTGTKAVVTSTPFQTMLAGALLAVGFRAGADVYEGTKNGVKGGVRYLSERRSEGQNQPRTRARSRSNAHQAQGRPPRKQVARKAA